MRLIKQWFGFYVFSNVHVAIAAYCLTKITFLEFGFKNEYLALFVFFSTILSYNLIRFFQLDKINSMTAIWIRANKKGLLVLNMLALSGVGFYAFKLSIRGMLALLPFFIATVFYVLPIKNKAIGLRHIPALKLILIAFSWVGITLYFPLQEAGHLDVSHQWLYFAQRFLFIIAITIPFDIRDAQFDLPELATLPQVLGVNRAKIVAVICMVVFILLSVALKGMQSNLFYADLILMLLSIGLILYCNQNRNRFYTTFWIEALPILWYGLYLILL
ncbi:hypothetical protein QWY87_17160 [Lutimonas halocynthiae]|uniref:hypothetical protein n=1 Tax=Lutimonas halocynthiae TaxID=1446477 RepID=UPI0025B43FE5|nr:hypothetical protein [Lutimonas halocynthiae]MDN3644446.1 hypothetical protein [Lutimonas halocynthiae]